MVTYFYVSTDNEAVSERKDSDELVWRALADATRREILDRLRVRAHTTGELARLFEITRFGVMKHLSVLVEADLVLVRRSGRERWNYLNAAALQHAVERWMTPFQHVHAGSLVRLRMTSERGGSPGRESQRAESQRADPSRRDSPSPDPSRRDSPLSDPARQGVPEEGEMISEPAVMHIEQEIRIGAPPSRVFCALTEEVGRWWGGGYRLLDERSAVRIDLRVGGHMYETSGERSASWGMVTAVEPDRELELTGRMGMGGAVLGVIRYTLEPDGEGTLLRLSHRASGEIDEKTESDYDTGWKYLLGDLMKSYVEENAR